MKEKKYFTIIISVFVSLLFNLFFNRSSFPESKDTRIIIDGTNRKVEIPAKPARVACFIGTSYESIFLLGHADKVKFISSFQFTPWAIKLNPDLKNAACLKSYSSPNIEELIKHRIDTVFYWSWPDQIEQMQNAGIAVICPVLLNKNVNSIEDFIISAKDNIYFYHTILGTKNKQRVEAYIKYFDRWADKIRKITSKLNKDQRPNVYYVGGSNIYETHGINTNTYWYVKLAGGNLVPAVRSVNHHIIVSAEQIAVLDPDIVLMGRMDSIEPVIQNPQWAGIKAVKNRRVFLTPEGVFYWDHSSEGILLLIYCAKLFHPDEFKDINLQDELKYFYSEFYGYHLTNDEALRILNHKPPADHVKH